LRDKTSVWPLTVKIDRVDGLIVLAPVGRIGAATAAQWEAALAEVGEKEDGKEDRKVVLDLKGVDYVSSAGIQALSSLLDRLPQQSTVVVCGLGDAVRLTFDLAGLLSRLTVAPSRAAALADP
jgi:anti-anti-sigma factor